MPDRDPKIDEGVRRPSDKWAATRAAAIAARTPTGKVKKVSEGGRTRYVGKGPAPAAGAAPAAGPTVAGGVAKISAPTPLDQRLTERTAKRHAEFLRLVWNEVQRSKALGQMTSEAHVTSRATGILGTLSDALLVFVDGGMQPEVMQRDTEAMLRVLVLQKALHPSLATLEDREEKSAAKHQAAMDELRTETKRLKELVVSTQGKNSGDNNAVSKFGVNFAKLEKIVSEHRWLMDILGDGMPDAETPRGFKQVAHDGDLISREYEPRQKAEPFQVPPPAAEPPIQPEPCLPGGLAAPMTAAEAEAAGITGLIPAAPVTDPGAFQTTQ